MTDHEPKKLPGARFIAGLGDRKVKEMVALGDKVLVSFENAPPAMFDESGEIELPPLSI